MHKGKNLLILLGVGALAYYLFMMKKKKDAAAPAVKNFTGDQGILAKQNFTGDLGVLNASGPSDRQLNRLERVMTRNPQRAQRMIKRMF